MRTFKIFSLSFFVLFASTACADGSDKSFLPENVEYLKVISVAKDDTLNMRAKPDGNAGIVFKLPPNAIGIIKLEQKKGWVKLSYKKFTGWAYGKYLAKTQAPSIKISITHELSCLGTEPHWILDSEQNKIKYKVYDDKKTFALNSGLEQRNNEWVLSGIHLSEKESSVISIMVKKDAQCTDDMSDNKYRYSISVEDKNMGTLKGCCR